jgi:hypothetical protein
MNDDLPTETVTREGVLKQPSDDEVAAVATAEAASQPANGDEYVDLDPEHLDVLPTKDVQELTWNKALMKLVPVVARPHLRLVKTATKDRPKPVPGR